MAGRKHTPDEIAAKVARGNEMATRGKSVREICDALGVSIMTYHRWKKRMNSAEALAGNEWYGNGEQGTQVKVGSAARIRQSQIENLQLREVLADMLLETRKIQEKLPEWTNRHVASVISLKSLRRSTLTCGARLWPSGPSDAHAIDCCHKWAISL